MGCVRSNEEVMGLAIVCRSICRHDEVMSSMLVKSSPIVDLVLVLRINFEKKKFTFRFGFDTPSPSARKIVQFAVGQLTGAGAQGARSTVEPAIEQSWQRFC